MSTIKKKSPMFSEYSHIFGAFDMTHTTQLYPYWKICFAENKQII